MKAKNTIKKISIFTLFIIITWLFSSCDYSKKDNTKTKNTNTSIETSKNLENTSNVTPTIKEAKSGRFKKIKNGEKVISIEETKTDAKEIKDATESSSWGGWAKGWTVTGANPLNM
jgi:hypothetical protein